MNRKMKIVLLCIIILLMFLTIMYLLTVTLAEVRQNNKHEGFAYDIKHNIISEVENKKSVLFISSYSPSFQTFDNQISGIKSVLTDDYVELDIEYMDTKRFYTEENLSNFYNNLEYKINNWDAYDAVITADDNALQFVMEYQDELFADTSIIFMGVNNIDTAANAAENSYITGIVEKTSMPETIEIAYNINPHANRVVALVDNTISGQADLDCFFSAETAIAGLEYTTIDLSDLTFDEFKTELNKLGENDIVLLLSVYKDKDNNTVTFGEGLKIVLDECGQPIYHPYFHGLGSGILGGKVISHYDQGVNAGNITKRVLNGEDISSIPLINESPNKVIFDYQVLKEYSIKNSFLPNDAIIINNDSLMYKYFLQVLYVLLLIVFELCIVIALGINISRRNKVEAEYNKFKLVTDRALNGHLITDMDGMILYCNYYYAKIHKYNISELINQNVAILYTSNQYKRFVSLKEQLITDESLKPTETEQTTKDGTPFPMLLSGIIFDDEKNQQQYLVYNAIDVSDIRFLEKKSTELEFALSEQQRLKAIGTLASGIAHEINNPVNGIMNYAQLILDNNDEKDDNYNFAHEIVYEANRVSEIVKNLLNYSRQDMEGMSFVYIYDVINSTLSLISTIIKKDNIKLNIYIDENLPKINCRSQQIQQIIMNLTTNARDSLNKKYTNYDEHKVINISCGKYKNNNIDYIRVSVEDFGTGISDEIASHVFEPFFTTKSRNEGTGLGLSISYNIAMEHNGSLSFDTKLGEYTRFYLDLPIKNE